MKRIISILLIAVLLCSLCSCGGKPNNMSDAMYQIGLNALNVADKYIAGEITAAKAYDQLGKFYKQAEEQIQKWHNDFGTDTLVGTKYEKDFLVSSDILLLNTNFIAYPLHEPVLSDVIEARDNLAETLGE